RNEYNFAPPEGKQLSSSQNMPVWIDIPPATREELIAAAEKERQKLLVHADAVMLDWRTELMLGEISDANRAKLSAWLAYKNEVKSWDIKTDPENVNWPVPPVV
ncbi:tail fiber assembly protein, partial [Citrobacter sp. Cpo032]